MVANLAFYFLEPADSPLGRYYNNLSLRTTISIMGLESSEFPYYGSSEWSGGHNCDQLS
jgi:hypothetical protein